MLMMLLFVSTVLFISHLTARWAHVRLGKDYWDTFILAALLSPFYTLFIVLPHLISRFRSDRQV
jgi:hypothetical protein